MWEVYVLLNFAARLCHFAKLALAGNSKSVSTSSRSLHKNDELSTRILGLLRPEIEKKLPDLLVTTIWKSTTPQFCYPPERRNFTSLLKTPSQPTNVSNSISTKNCFILQVSHPFPNNVVIQSAGQFDVTFYYDVILVSCKETDTPPDMVWDDYSHKSNSHLQLKVYLHIRNYTIRGYFATCIAVSVPAPVVYLSQFLYVYHF